MTSNTTINTKFDDINETLDATLSETAVTFTATLAVDDQSFGADVGEVIVIDKYEDYNKLLNKPSIENIPLVGSLTLNDFGLRPMTASEILKILK